MSPPRVGNASGGSFMPKGFLENPIKAAWEDAEFKYEHALLPSQKQFTTRLQDLIAISEEVWLGFGKGNPMPNRKVDPAEWRTIIAGVRKQAETTAGLSKFAYAVVSGLADMAKAVGRDRQAFHVHRKRRTHGPRRFIVHWKKMRLLREIARGNHNATEDHPGPCKPAGQ